MKKFIFIFLIVTGLGIIGMGIFLQVNDNKELTQENKIEEINKEEDNNSLKEIERINIFNTETICSDYEKIDTYINTSDYKKITFTYPNCVQEYLISYWNKTLQNKEHDTNMDIHIERDTLNNYMNERKTYAIALKNDYGYEVEYTDIQKTTNINNQPVAIFETNYKNDYGVGSFTKDTLDIAVELEEKLLLVFEISAKNEVFDTKVIEELINNIKVEEDAAVFSDAKIEGEYQVGSIKSNFQNSYEHGYKVIYKTPKEYPVTPSFLSDLDAVTFEYEDLYKSLYVNMTIKTGIFLNDFEQEINNSNDITLKTYIEDPDRYRNFKTTGILFKEINNKKVYYYIYTYDYYYKDEKLNDGYFATVLYELRPQMYVDLYMSTKGIAINEQLISDYLNFTVEEY